MHFTPNSNGADEGGLKTLRETWSDAARAAAAAARKSRGLASSPQDGRRHRTKPGDVEVGGKRPLSRSEAAFLLWHNRRQGRTRYATDVGRKAAGAARERIRAMLARAKAR